MKDFVKESKYERDFPEEGDWNWKTITLNTPNRPNYHNHKIIGVLLHDGSFVVNGVHFSKEEVGEIEDDPFSSIAKKATEEKVFDIDVSGQVMLRVTIIDNVPTIICAMNGYGDSIDISYSKVIPIEKENEEKDNKSRY